MKNILFTTHLDDKFIDGALVMIYSMKKNVKDFMDYPIRVLHSNVISELSLENRERIKKLVPHVEFVDINNETYNNAPVQYPKHRVAFLSLECFRSIQYEKVFFFDCDMLCIGDISDMLETAPSDWVSGCGGSPTDIKGTTRLFTQHMINAIVPEFNLISDDYNWKVAPTTDSNRKITEYGITDTTKIIHWAGALPDQNRKPYPKPWEESRDSNSLTQLWYQYKDEMLEAIND